MADVYYNGVLVGTGTLREAPPETNAQKDAVEEAKKMGRCPAVVLPTTWTITITSPPDGLCGCPWSDEPVTVCPPRKPRPRRNLLVEAAASRMFRPKKGR